MMDLGNDMEFDVVVEPTEEELKEKLREEELEKERVLSDELISKLKPYFYYEQNFKDVLFTANNLRYNTSILNCISNKLTERFRASWGKGNYNSNTVKTKFYATNNVEYGYLLSIRCIRAYKNVDNIPEALKYTLKVMRDCKDVDYKDFVNDMSEDTDLASEFEISFTNRCEKPSEYLKLILYRGNELLKTLNDTVKNKEFKYFDFYVPFDVVDTNSECMEEDTYDEDSYCEDRFNECCEED